jgi:hypothetical protein
MSAKELALRSAIESLPRFMKSHLVLSVLLALALASCATGRRNVPFRVTPNAPVTGKMARYDYSDYSRIPDTLTSFTFRSILKTIPYTSKRAFWGNWAGSGNRGGLPVDIVDEIYRRHDIAYTEADTARTMRWADDACIAALAKLNLTGEEKIFCDRACAFFQDKTWSWMGKRWGAFFQFKESPDCPFQTKEDVEALFKFDHKRALLAPKPAVKR